MLPLGGGVCLSLTGVGCVAGVPILAGGMKLPEKTEVKFDGAKPAKTTAKKKPTTVAARARY